MIGYDGSARELLSELAASGGATLFVDGLDYFGDRERAVVCDLVDEASKIAGFDLIVTARRDFGKDEANWLPPEALVRLGRVQTVVIDELSNEEARALIHDPRILILDEATSALDPESEAVVSANLLRIARGRTMIIVSHRLSSLVECDQILVMEQGQAADIAPHRVLLERCLPYRQLWMQQTRHMDSQGPRSAPTPGLVHEESDPAKP